MKPAICAAFDYSIPFDRAIPMIRNAGFEAVSLGASPEYSDYRTAEGIAAIQKLLVDNGMTLDSIHAPWAGDGPLLFSLDEIQRFESIRQCQLAIDAAEKLGSRIVVIHLLYGVPPHGTLPGDVRDRMIEHGRGSVSVLAAHAASRGVKLALENGEDSHYDKVLVDFLTEFNDARIGFCYDSGHENVQGTCFKLLEQFGHRLLAVHIHDNNGADTHALPYEGTIDWARFREIFHGLRYDGNLHLEAVIDNSRFKDPAVFLSQAMERVMRLLRTIP